MNKRISKKMISLLLVLALVVLVGCQALGSLDLNKSIIDAMIAKSQMSKETIALDIKVDESKTSLTGSELTMLKVLSHVKLKLDQINQESFEKFSINGKLEVLNRSIPFQATISPQMLVLKVEGAKKPLVIDLAGKAVDTEALLPLGIEKEMIEQFTDKLTNDVNLHKAIYGFLVNGMPNPEGITLENVTETVNGESMSLHHVQAKADFTQILPLIQKFLVNLLQDDKGLRELVTQFYDIAQPVLMSVFKKMDEDKANAESAPSPSLNDTETPSLSDQIDNSVLGSDFGSTILQGFESVLKDRTMAIEFLNTEAKQLLVLAMVGLQSVNEIKDPLKDEILNKKSYVKADLYIDNDGKLRKTKAEVNFVPPADENEGIEEVKLTLETEHWNINQSVTAEVINTTDSYTMDSITKPSEMLSILDKDSSLYHFLKDDLQITKKSLVLNLSESAYEPYSMQPYIDRDVTMVPVRFVTEQLDADVKFNEEKHEISIQDTGMDTTIVLTLQSDIAVLNGQTVKLKRKVQNRDGTTYVPLNFIADALGATLKWDKETKSITLTRD
jgi:uncharacterized protein YqgQ